MMVKIKYWVSKHLKLAPLMIIFVMIGICSCKTPVVVAEKETTTITVKQRKIPVFTPKVDINAKGKIFITPEGIPRLGEINVTTNSDKPKNKQPKVIVKLDEAGNLNIDVNIAPDSINVIVNDSTKHTIQETTNIVEKNIQLVLCTITYIRNYADC